ncbi:MAG: methyltransferase domain-containing protein [Eubacterium sp.]
MVTYEQVENYIKQIGLKPFKTPDKFAVALASKTDKAYAREVLNQLNARAQGAPVSNKAFYELKNQSLSGSLVISAAFDLGIFKRIGNLIVDNKDYFNGTVLDVGCDCGIVTCFMAKQYPQCKIVGVDVNAAAIENARALAQRLELNNVEFVCGDIYEAGECDYSVVTSFRCLLDITEKETKPLAFFGERAEREKQYCNAFANYAKALADCLKDGGLLLSVERYTAEYGWLGWLSALSANGVNADCSKCKIVGAADVSSRKEYSLSVLTKSPAEKTPLEVFDFVMSKNFKGGKACDGAQAEFALYKEADSDIQFTDIYKKERLIHQYAFAKTTDGYMAYDASATKRKLTYFKEGKLEYVEKDYNSKLDLYKNNEIFSVKTYKITPER